MCSEIAGPWSVQLIGQVEWLAAAPNANAVRAILLTGEWNEAVKTKASKAGAHFILANPCCVETLLAVVAQAISDLDPLWGRR